VLGETKTKALQRNKNKKNDPAIAGSAIGKGKNYQAAKTTVPPLPSPTMMK